MNRLRLYLRAAWLAITRLPAWPEAQQWKWTRADTEQLHAFLCSDTGRKLIGAKRLMEQTQTWRAIAARDPFACGVAWGWKVHNDWLLTLATLPAAPPKEGTDPLAEEGPGELFDRLSGP